MAKGISLHIGVNECHPDGYGGWTGPLRACEFDANDMFELATGQGFEARKLLTAEATHDAVTSGIREAAAKLAPGDMFFLSYSGHGGQVLDINKDDEDGKDETWCLYDKQLIDDELRALWPEFQEGVRILVLSDSCHSGTVTRAPEVDDPALGEIVGSLQRFFAAHAASIRAMPTERALEAYRARESYYSRVQRALPDPPGEIKATVRLISGCQDNQQSFDGKRNGVFTARLRSVWNEGAFTGDYTRFHGRILAGMPAIQTPNHDVIGRPNPAFDAQRPFEI